MGFSLLTGINDDTFNSWRTGEVRASSGHSAAVKRWKKECELALADRTSEQNSVGSMFLLKSCYGYSEQQTVNIVDQTGLPKESRAEIAKKYAEHQQLPQKPNL